MIFCNSDDDSVCSNSSVIYDNSYVSSNYMTSYCNSIEENKSRNTSRDNSYKSQNYMEYIKENIISTKIKPKKNQVINSLKKKNIKLKFNLVIEELKLNYVKNLLYKMNYNLILQELKNRELEKYYDYGKIYTKFIKALN